MVTQHIIPAIIPESYDYLQQRVKRVLSVVRHVQIDVMDGTYAPGSSWPYNGIDQGAFSALRREDEGLPYWQEMDYEIDLLVRNPEEHVDEWVLAGAATLIAHIESTDSMEEVFKQCYDRRVEVALAIKPSTDLETLAPFVERATFVQIMGNDRIGEHGVPLDVTVHDKIRALHERWPETVVGVDIGVHPDTVPGLVESGATRFASGSAIFASPNPASAYRELEALAGGEA